MSLFRRTAVLAAALAAVTSLPAPAQQASLAGDLLTDLKEVEEKLVGLAKAIFQPSSTAGARRKASGPSPR